MSFVVVVAFSISATSLSANAVTATGAVPSSSVAGASAAGVRLFNDSFDFRGDLEVLEEDDLLDLRGDNDDDDDDDNDTLLLSRVSSPATATAPGFDDDDLVDADRLVLRGDKDVDDVRRVADDDEDDRDNLVFRGWGDNDDHGRLSPCRDVAGGVGDESFLAAVDEVTAVTAPAGEEEILSLVEIDRTSPSELFGTSEAFAGDVGTDDDALRSSPLLLVRY